MGDFANWGEPFAWYRTMRSKSPVAYSPLGDYWSIFRYDDVQTALFDHATYSSQLPTSESATEDPVRTTLMFSDGPRHHSLRSAITRCLFRLTTDWADQVTTTTNALLDRVTSAGAMDVVGDLAYPLPVLVVGGLLGVPMEEFTTVKRWSNAFVLDAESAGGPGLYDETQREVCDLLRKSIRARQLHPTSDLVSALLASSVEGQRLSEPEILGICLLLLVAGTETATNLIGNAFWCLFEQPSLLEELRQEPSLMPAVVEEVLRFRSPVQSMFRVATKDTILGDQMVRAGQSIRLWLGAANRDEAQFPSPDSFEIRRSPNRHLAFGSGSHACLAAPLARLEARIALARTLARLPNLARGPRGDPDLLHSGIVLGLKRLMVVF
jgi:cytochrome P450